MYRDALVPFSALGRIRIEEREIGLQKPKPARATVQEYNGVMQMLRIVAFAVTIACTIPMVVHGQDAVPTEILTRTFLIRVGDSL